MSYRGRYVLQLGGVMSGALYLGGVMTVNQLLSRITSLPFEVWFMGEDSLGLIAGIGLVFK